MPAIWSRLPGVKLDWIVIPLLDLICYGLVNDLLATRVWSCHTYNLWNMHYKNITYVYDKCKYLKCYPESHI